MHSKPIKPIEPVKSIEPNRHVSSAKFSSPSNSDIFLALAGAAFVIFILVVIVFACFKHCRRRKPDQTTAVVYQHAPSPTYTMYPIGVPTMSPSAPPPPYSPPQQSSPRYF